MWFPSGLYTLPGQRRRGERRRGSRPIERSNGSVDAAHGPLFVSSLILLLRRERISDPRASLGETGRGRLCAGSLGGNEREATLRPRFARCGRPSTRGPRDDPVGPTLLISRRDHGPAVFIFFDFISFSRGVGVDPSPGLLRLAGRFTPTPTTTTTTRTIRTEMSWRDRAPHFPMRMDGSPGHRKKQSLVMGPYARSDLVESRRKAVHDRTATASVPVGSSVGPMGNTPRPGCSPFPQTATVPDGAAVDPIRSAVFVVVFAAPGNAAVELPAHRPSSVLQRGARAVRVWARAGKRSGSR